MTAQTQKKVKQKPRGKAIGPDNPIRSPGRPKGDLLVREQLLQPGISERLAAVRAAVKWTSKKKLPGNGTVRLYVELKWKNSRDFAAIWERLEKEFEVGTAAVVSAVDPKAEEEPMKATETDEELREAIVELLRKHGEAL